MINKFNKLLIILLITFAGADRINFGVNLTDSFKLTPFLLLSIIYLAFTLTFFIKRIKLNWLVENQFFLSSFTLFLCLVIMSAVFSPAVIISSKRIVLLFIIIIIIIIILSEYDASQINIFLIYSSICGSILFLIFNGLLLTTWLRIIQIDLAQIDLIPDTIAYYIPRLGGFSGDSNRGGFVLSFYTYILWVNRRKISFSGFLLCLNLAMLLLTLSRTTYLLLFILFLSYALLFQRHLFNI